MKSKKEYYFELSNSESHLSVLTEANSSSSSEKAQAARFILYKHEIFKPVRITVTGNYKNLTLTFRFDKTHEPNHRTFKLKDYPFKQSANNEHTLFTDEKFHFDKILSDIIATSTDPIYDVRIYFTLEQPFDAVQMMRDIREMLSEKYWKHPEILKKEMVAIRKKYNLNIAESKVS